MNGIKANGVTLFIGKLPYRKQECFYFEKGSSIYPIAYIPDRYLIQTKQLWEEMLKGVRIEANK